ncbi:Glycosyltransferase [Rubrobacter radiotolerans]|uniref:Glycosyltransferase n=1 Tax=Rubrobacter radiotolerans TaxID=42256 RepID=A0A023X1H5_RUBRA|nr:glycosyltransferase family 4 protein [Rubrobacter radiotolerans]AHY46036.1 Glycosyltransferase [Rubrobacter radiotolerans]MDX5893448.1 glycosyltransferase family 4 protein [Rubrobacter radiotolerans]SMC03757.1 Glycosyltransferase involved in cell wall bisynthesis [Rubrobacter radiotolerans DSM 5868]
MKVLFVTSTFPRSEDDDQVPWLLELTLVLRERGLDVEVLAPTYEGLSSHRVFGVPVHRYRYWRKTGEVVTHEAGAMNKMERGSGLFLPALSLVGAGTIAAARLARRRKFDVIHSHWPLPMGLPAQAADWYSRGAPGLVATFHGAEVALAKRKSHYRPVLKWLTGNLDAAISNSRSTAATVEELTGVRPEVIPFGPPRGSVDFGRGPEDGASGDDGLPVVLAVGRMIERKGFPVLVRAAKRLRGRARVVIVGGGEYESVVRREVERAGVGDVVTLAGRLSNAELAAAYAGCAVFCLPAVLDSRGETEGLGVVLIEAMSHGKPVVASDIGGIPDAVEAGETGLLVKPNDPDALADALLSVVRDDTLARRLGEAGRRRARDLFSWESVAERHLALYRRAISRASAPAR